MEKHEFQADVKQVLDIVAHSLYTHPEVFLRELVSNASDASEKLRLLKMQDKPIFDPDLDLEIRLTTDENAGTLTLQDFGVGMTRSELVENLGMIANSGSRKFLEALKESQQNSEALIGRFGVGFYSVFMVASRVEVFTRSWEKEAEPLIWKSDGGGSYEIEEAEGLRRGTKMVIHLKPDMQEFSKPDRIKGILEKYSNFISFPIQLNGDKINTVEALWLKSKQEITEEQYENFYRFVSHSWDKPRFKLHFTADAPLQINALLFVPENNMERMAFNREETDLGLYCRKVLIDPHPKGFLPPWCRFLKGVVDCADLPLNISRESLQDTTVVQKLGKVITRRFIKFLQETLKKDRDGYTGFFREFSIFIKEGIHGDFENRETLSGLLLFESSTQEAGKLTTLSEYLERAPADQDKIYYLCGKSRKSLEASPYLEAFRKRNIEVLFLTEEIDPFFITQLGNYEKKDLQSIDSKDVDLASEGEEEGGLSEDSSNQLRDWVSALLKDDVAEVRVGSRLSDSPAAVYAENSFMTPQMRQLMKQTGSGELPPEKVILEFNRRHPLTSRILAIKEKDEELAGLVVRQSLDQAKLAAGLLEDPSEMVRRGYQLLEKMPL